MPYAERQKRLEQSRNWYYAHRELANKNRRKFPVHTAKREPGPPDFICVDGEGITPHDKHLYTYLAASNGTAISDWNSGLSTRQCFDFCLSLKRPYHVVCGFSVGYDHNMFFRDISPAFLEVLWNTNEVILPLDNSWYKLVYIPSKFLNISLLDNVTLNDDKKLEYKIKKSVRVWDVFGFFQGSFLKLLENGEWIPLHEMGQEVLDLIANMKAARHTFRSEDREQIEHYCREEVRILQELMNRLAATLWSADIRLQSWHGAGAIAGYLLKKHLVRNACKTDNMPDVVQSAALWGYFGGRVELMQQGPISGPLYDYDRISAYPSAAIELPDLSNGRWYQVDGGEIHARNPVCKYGLWRVSWDTRNHAQSWLGPFPQRSKDGAIYWLAQGSGWYHTSEVLAAIKIFGGKIQIESGFYFLDSEEKRPFSWVRDLLLTRLEYKRLGDPRHIVLKLGANSLYGKLAQGTERNGRKPLFQNYFLAGYITANCRANMLHAASLLSHDSCVSIATDGLFCTREIDIDLTGGIGGWEKSVIDEDSFWAQAGVYYTPQGKHVRTRGFNPKSMTYERLLDEWNSTPDFARGDMKLEYEENRFVGLGYAASTGHWEEYRSWVDRKRYLTLRTLPRKEQESVEWQEAMLLHPGSPSITTVPYRPKEEYNAEVRQYPDELLDIFELLDQPDYPIE